MTTPSTVDRVSDPDTALGPNWRQEQDRVVTTSSDETGLHLLVADRTEAYHWRTVATLVEPGVETDQWIGQFCVTASQRRAAVVYAPRQLANKGDLMTSGAFAAIVDLDTGRVVKLAERVSLAYYDPACGSDEQVVLSRFEGDETKAATRVFTVDATTGTILRTAATGGQLTSPTPVGGTVLAASASGLVEVGPDGRRKPVADIGGTPYRLVPDGTGGVAFQLSQGDQTRFLRYRAGTVSQVATATTGTARLHRGAGGRVFAVGTAGSLHWDAGTPSGWQTVDAAVDGDVSGTGRITVISSTSTAAAVDHSGIGVDGRADPVRIAATTDGRRSLAFSLQPDAHAAGAQRSPALGGTATNAAPSTAAPSSGAPSSGASAQTARSSAASKSATTTSGTLRAAADADPASTPYDTDRTCAVPRNDPKLQTYQPSPRQVEWAADLAVKGQLTMTRPQNYNNNGLAAYVPQTLFPIGTMQAPAGAPNQVPAQLLLGILAQESNLRQASWHIVDGSAGNPLTSTTGFYGLDKTGSPDSINWGAVDCGYGVGQVTTGMRRVDTNTITGLTDLQQKAVATDYVANIAASLQLLVSKWNQLYTSGILANGGDPRYIENWFPAVWAYNSGFHVNVGTGTWGLGWANNPANPVYPKDRQPYLTGLLTTSKNTDLIPYDNAKHPSDWPYPERIMGWAHTPVLLPDYADGGTYKATYLPGTWPPSGFTAAQPPPTAFCVANVNNCDPAAPAHKSKDPNYSTEPAGPCQQDDLTKCWWHSPLTWTTCETLCGTENLHYTAASTPPVVTNIYPAQCNVTGIPAPPSTLIIDDVTTSTPLGPSGCQPVTPGGQFSLHFAAGTSTATGNQVYPSKVDFHQAGGGFGGHFWFAHTQAATEAIPTTSTDPVTEVPNRLSLTVTGDWTPSQRLNGWVQVMVHIPNNGMWTQQAHYHIFTGTGTRDRFISGNSHRNEWVQLGTYNFGGSGTQKLELSNLTLDGQGNQDIAWDAAAFRPLSAKPKFVVAMGDSYESGEGLGNYYPQTDHDYTDTYWNACRRSTDAWPRKVNLPGLAPNGQLADGFDPHLDFQFIACSGANASQMMSNRFAPSPPSYWSKGSSLAAVHDSANGQFYEMNQIDAGALSSDTDVVLLSAGGNDAGFSDTVEDCSLSDCTSKEATYNGKLDFAKGEVRSLVDSVHERAPNAAIVLVGYPRLFASNSQGCTFLLAAYTSTETALLNRLAAGMETRQAALSTEANQQGNFVYHVDTFDKFGDYGNCNRDPKVLTGLNFVLPGPNGPGDFSMDGSRCLGWFAIDVQVCISRSSFHPNTLGAARYTAIVNDELAAIMI